MEIEHWMLLTLLTSAIGCAVIPFFPSRSKPIVALATVFLIGVFSCIAAIVVLRGQAIEIVFSGIGVFGDIPVRIDPLAAWFILIINLTCINGTLYGMGYMRAYEGQRNSLSLHWCLLIVFQLSMLWVCSLQHGLVFLIAWEVMSVASFLLILFDHTKVKTIQAGVNYLVQMHIGVACLTAAIIWLVVSEGSYDFVAMTSFVNKAGAAGALVLLFVGFGIKAGFVPLHTWLPHAHPAAPSHISGIMSGVIVKMGIYGILRMITFINTDLLAIGETILLISVITAFYGILNAAIQRDFKRMLAFCTIENIGIVGIGIGIGLVGKGLNNNEMIFLGFGGALLHVLNHSLYKPLLFFASGNVYKLTHTRNMEHLGGLIKIIPFSGLFFLIGSLSIGGLPPFNGFTSKFLIYSSLVEAIHVESFELSVMMVGCIAGLALAGGLSIFTFVKSFGIIFLGSPRSKYKHHQKERLSYADVPFFVIIAMMLAIGIFPASVIVPIQKVIQTLATSSVVASLDAAIPVMSNVGIASVALITLVTGIYFLRTRIEFHKGTRISTTWGCGYIAPSSKMQYSGKSFSKPLAKLFSFLTGEQKKYHEIESDVIFPSGGNYQSSYPEFFEKNLIDKVSNQLLYFLNWFRFIHNGQVQMYVLYGFLFVLVLIIATFLNLL
jgi:formate hydrogenlyase subunit 3/multisubunit Na+/H+ antiporter MnhD subunit